MKLKCKFCGTLYEGRADSKYCSPNCRQGANRDKSVTDKSEKRVNVTDKGAKCDIIRDNVTDNETTGAENTGVIQNDYNSQFVEENAKLRDEWEPSKVSDIHPPLIDEWWRNETRAFKQLKYNLEHLSVAELERRKYWIPAWKTSDIDLSSDKYSCGCEKKDGLLVCKKHQRI